jgi:hypothetical protein
MVKYQAPSGNQVKEALRRIPTFQLRRAFFEGLKNPLWVEPLAKEGVFRNPPEPEKMDDGLIRDIYWPEMDYLIRVAPEAPAAVVEVLLKIFRSNNAWVRRGLFTIGASIPADQAARLQPVIRSWQSTGFGWRTDPQDLATFALNLLQGGQYEVGKWFANLIFSPSKGKRHQKPDLVLEDYWYKRELPRIVADLGDDGLSVVLPWLVAYERYRGRLTKKFDITYFSRDSVRIRTDSHDPVEQVLIDAVRDLAIRAMLVDPAGAKEMLLKTEMILARKIALFALSEAIRRVADDTSKLAYIVTTATELLFQEKSGDAGCRLDYAELARAVATVSPESLDGLEQFIEIGPRVEGDRLREWVRRDGDDETDVDERAQEYGEQWQHRWLSAIGTQALPARLQTRLAELDSKYGVIEAPLEPTRRITTWTGPNSPLSQDEMATMSPAELVAHLESWHDSGIGFGPEPSHEGQGRELTGLVTTNPKAIAGIDDLLVRLRPIYLRAILTGWEAAVKADLQLDWGQVADIISGVLGHSDESSFPVEGGQGDDDVDFRGAKQAATGLLEKLAKKRTPPTIPADAMSRFADMLISSGADDNAWDEYNRDHDSGMDPLTTSLNWQWPIRVRGLIYLMSHGTDTVWYGAARSALETELAREDSRGASRAVIGEGLGRLLTVDEDWLKPRVAELFGSAEGLTIEQQVALTTAMAVHRYHPELYELLGPSMIAAIRSKVPFSSGWHSQTDPLQRIGEWVIDAIIRGHKTIDDPVAHEFFANAPAKVRGEALGHIAWAFMHAETVDDALRDRFAELWDTRIAHVRSHPDDNEELDGFYWVVKSHKFAIEWWLPRLKEAAELDPSLSSERYMIGKEIATSADVDPRTAFDVLKLLLKADESGATSYDLTRNAVPMVIARGISSGDDSLKQDAVAYMNYLGEKGHISLEGEVYKVLEGEITQADVDD